MLSRLGPHRCLLLGRQRPELGQLRRSRSRQLRPSLVLRPLPLLLLLLLLLLMLLRRLLQLLLLWEVHLLGR